MEDSHIDNILKQIDLETSSVDAGHEAYNKAISGKKFNQNYSHLILYLLTDFSKSSFSFLIFKDGLKKFIFTK